MSAMIETVTISHINAEVGGALEEDITAVIVEKDNDNTTEAKEGVMAGAKDGVTVAGAKEGDRAEPT